MIRHFAATAAIALTAGVLSSCNQPPATTSDPTPQSAPAVSDSGNVAKATALLDHIVAGEFGPVVAEFDATMTAAMPAEMLAATMTQLGQQVGPFVERTNTREAEEAGYDVVYITTVFEKATLNTKVVYDAEGQVAGLFFQP